MLHDLHAATPDDGDHRRVWPQTLIDPKKRSFGRSLPVAHAFMVVHAVAHWPRSVPVSMPAGVAVTSHDVHRLVHDWQQAGDVHQRVLHGTLAQLSCLCVAGMQAAAGSMHVTTVQLVAYEMLTHRHNEHACDQGRAHCLQPAVMHAQGACP